MGIRRFPGIDENPLQGVLGHLAVTTMKIASDVHDLERAEEQQPLYPCLRDLTADRTIVRHDHVLNVDAGDGNVNLTLPAVASSKSWGLWVKKVDATANTVTLTPQVGETIEGASTYVLREQNEVVLCICDGLVWYVYTKQRAGDAKHAAVFQVEGTLATETGVIRFYNQFGRDLTIIEVFAAVNTAPVGSSIIVDIHKGGTTIFTTQSNRPTIAAGANTGTTTTIEVPTWSDGQYLTLDIDQVGSGTAGSDLTVQVICRL